MAFAREIFIRIKQVIKFQQSNKEADSHYTLIGNTLVRISNHCTYMKVWDNYFKENPRMKGKPILSLVFEDNGDTFTDECLFSIGNKIRPIKVKEYVFESNLLTKQDINLITRSLQNLAKTNNFIDFSKKGVPNNRISVYPHFNNKEAQADGIAQENNQENIKENMSKNRIRLTESQLHRIVNESVKKVLRETNESVKSEVEHILSRMGRSIKEWTSDNSFTDMEGCYGFIFDSKGQAMSEILAGSEHEYAIDCLLSWLGEKEMVQTLTWCGLDKRTATRIVQNSDWEQAVQIIVNGGGPEWFLSQCNGEVHTLSNGQLLYY